MRIVTSPQPWTVWELIVNGLPGAASPARRHRPGTPRVTARGLVQAVAGAASVDSAPKRRSHAHLKSQAQNRNEGVAPPRITRKHRAIVSPREEAEVTTP